MILRELQTYLAQHQRVSLSQLALHFRIEADALRGMLTTLERKGRVQKLDGASCCGHGGCHSCDAATLEFYEWVAAR